MSLLDGILRGIMWLHDGNWQINYRLNIVTSDIAINGKVTSLVLNLNELIGRDSQYIYNVAKTDCHHDKFKMSTLFQRAFAHLVDSLHDDEMMDLFLLHHHYTQHPQSLLLHFLPLQFQVLHLQSQLPQFQLLSLPPVLHLPPHMSHWVTYPLFLDGVVDFIMQF